MKSIKLILLFVFLLSGCTDVGSDKAAKKKLTTHQRDSVLAKSRLPGAGAVGRAIEVSDSAAVRAKRINKLTE